MKLHFPVVFVIGLMMPVYGAALEIDFDGSKGVSSAIIEEINKQSLAFAPPDKHLQMEFAMKTDSGEWLPLKPERKDDRDYLQIEPGAVFTWSIWCANNYDFEMWGFQSTYEMRNTPGHIHWGVKPPPPLRYANDNVFPNPISVYPIAPTSKYIMELRAPVFASQIYFKAHSAPCGNSDVSSLLDVMVKDLKPMPEGDTTKGYYLQKITTDVKHHPSPHNVIPGFEAVLKKLGAYWVKTCPSSDSLQYQRMSLPWGGIFDRDLDWDLKSPYFKHSRGIAADISKFWVQQGNRQGLINTMCNMGLEVYSEKDSDTFSHYHVTPRAQGADSVPAGAIACCKQESGQSPSPHGCINDSQSDDFPQPSKPDCELPYYQVVTSVDAE